MSQDKESLWVEAISVIFSILLVVWIAHQQAKTFNELCNANITAWQAAFVDLPVDNCVKEQPK